MKVSFIALSILSAMLTWWWVSHSKGKGRAAARGSFASRLVQSLIAGAVVYFGLMAIAMVWLLFTT